MDEEEDDPDEFKDFEDKGILKDTQEDREDDGLVKDEEGLTHGEPAPPTLQSSAHRQYYQPHCNHGKISLLMRTPTMHVRPLSHSETFT